MLQGKYWIDMRRAPGGHKTREGCYRQQNEGYQGNSWEIVWLEAVEQRGHHARCDGRQRQTNSEAGERQRHATSTAPNAIRTPISLVRCVTA